VLDASLIAKLVLDEPGSREARALAARLADEAEELRAPCIALAEAANAVWKHHAVHREITREEYREAMARLRELWSLIESRAVEELLPRAAEIAAETHVTLYDALYAALAEETGETLYTFDKRLANALKDTAVPVKLLEPRGTA